MTEGTPVASRTRGPEPFRAAGGIPTGALSAGAEGSALATRGSKGRVLPPSGAGTIAAPLPGATAYVMSGTGHLTHPATPNATASAHPAF